MAAFTAPPHPACPPAAQRSADAMASRYKTYDDDAASAWSGNGTFYCPPSQRKPSCKSGDGPRCNTSFVDYLSAENCPCFVSPRKQASREGALSKWAAEAINPRPMCYDTDRSREESGPGRGTPRPQENRLSFLPSLQEWINNASEYERCQAYDLFNKYSQPAGDGGYERCESRWDRRMASPYREGRLPPAPSMGVRTSVPLVPERFPTVYSGRECRDDPGRPNTPFWAYARDVYLPKPPPSMPSTGYGMTPLGDTCAVDTDGPAGLFHNAHPPYRRHFIIHPEFASERRVLDTSARPCRQYRRCRETERPCIYPEHLTY